MLVSRFKNNDKCYVFSGTVKKEIKDIFIKLENRKPITKEDQKILKDNYPNYYMLWIDFIKKGIPIKFIEHKIHMDDNVNDIRKKIFVYISDNKYLLPKNQELWLQKKDKTYEIIGYNYTNNITKEKIKLVPHIYKKVDNVELLFQENSDFFTNSKKNTAENNMLIYDLLANSEFMNEIIYVSDAMDEKKYLETKIQGNIDKNKSKNYFKKYWPYADIEFKDKNIQSELILLKDYYKKEQELFDLMGTIKINKDYFGSCNIITALFTINGDPYNEEGVQEFIDIFPIFDYLRETKMDEKTPFIKYSDESFDTPFYIISKKAVANNKIDKKTLRNWLGINKEHRKLNGLTVKRYLKDYNGKPRFSEIFITNTGKIALNMSFSTESNANFKDIDEAVKDCKKFIEDINKSRITRTGEKDKIEPPDFTYLDSKITIKKNTKIMYTNVIIPFTSPKVIDFNKLRDFSKKFPYFLVEVPKDVIKKDSEKDENLSFKLKYKRVSGFVNMNDILSEIDQLKQLDKYDNSIIIKHLEKKFQKSFDEIKGYMLEWEKKYSSKKSNIASSFKKGILISVSNNGILLNGITKIYQIPLLYNFFTFYIGLFLDYDIFIKQKEVKMIFSKNINYTMNQNNNSTNENVYENIYIDYKNINNNYNNSEFKNNNNQNFPKQVEEKEVINEIEEKETIDNIYNSNVDESETFNNSVTQTSNVTGSNYKSVHPDLKMKCPQEIVDKGTCKDFCDDQKYFIRRLRVHDPELFFKDKTKKGKNKTERYSRKCQESESAQPIVLAYDPATNKRVKKEAYSYTFKYSSDPEKLNRWYICPKIWCAYCEIPIPEEEIDQSTVVVRVSGGGSKKCKVAQCPYGDHLVFIRDSGHYYPGFLDPSKEKHPKDLCMPCCFKIQHDSPKSKFYSRYKKCLGDEIENVITKDDAIYVLSSRGAPISKDRYANVSKEVGRILNSYVESGYLKKNSGYLRKGIKQFNNNSFLSCIIDVLNCNNNESKKNISISNIKDILINKLDETIFLSLYGGNLPTIFHNSKVNSTPIHNFKNYIVNENIEITHSYLWDYLQRPTILFKDGVNIFIFSDDHLLCPKGENINTFYNKNRKSIFISKYGIYYEPIYYLEGTGKSADITCLFDSDNNQVKKIFDIIGDGCKMKFDIDWLSVLRDNIKKYNIQIDNESLENGVKMESLLKNNMNIKLQYVDLNNKVFAVLLENGLYVPVSPVKLNNTIPFRIVSNEYDVEKPNIKDIVSLYKKYGSLLNCQITHKVLDIKKQNIIALVNQHNRFIPVKKELNSKTIALPESVMNYYNDVDEVLYTKINKLDNRINVMNRKYYEDETFIRMKFELAKYLKKNKEQNTKIMNILNENDAKRDIIKSRESMIKIVRTIFDLLTTTENPNIDYNQYVTPNKRLPCSNRSIYGNKNEDYSCKDDPHCTVYKKSCKLFVNPVNLITKNKNNYQHYIAKIVDELLRFKLKRNEIMNDTIPIIINKELIKEQYDKYIVLHTDNINELVNVVDNLYREDLGVYLDNRKLSNFSETKEYGFKKERYIKSDKLLFKDYESEPLPLKWNKLLSDNFNVRININQNLFGLMTMILNFDELRLYRILPNEVYTTRLLKNTIVDYISKLNENELLSFYKKYGDSLKSLFYISSQASLVELINNESYNGTLADLEYISKIFKLNIVVLEKRLKKGEEEFRFMHIDQYESNYFILFMRTNVLNSYVYNIIDNKGRILFKMEELPSKFMDYITTKDGV
jgi:hypothetical protein